MPLTIGIRGISFPLTENLESTAWIRIQNSLLDYYHYLINSVSLWYNVGLDFGQQTTSRGLSVAQGLSLPQVFKSKSDLSILAVPSKHTISNKPCIYFTPESARISLKIDYGEVLVIKVPSSPMTTLRVICTCRFSPEISLQNLILSLSLILEFFLPKGSI